MTASDPIVIVPCDPTWPDAFHRIGRRARGALGSVALRVDHVGSTSVAGLDAKPVIDVQVSVGSLLPEAPYRDPLRADGFRFRPENPDRTKRFFLGPPDEPAAHVHVREQGSFDERLNLLFRDYLRTNAESAREYARTKRELAKEFRDDREGYVRAKEPTVWRILIRAHDWAQSTGWSPGPSDL